MRYFALVLIAATLMACGNNGPSSTGDPVAAASDSIRSNAGWYGEPFEVTEVIAVSQVPEVMNDTTRSELIVQGTIQECCQKKGCWMKVDMGNGESMRVTFKDYGFFVPLDAAGKTVTMKGVAYYDTLDVEYLKHLAEDANASQEEIDAITEPELSVSFEATGVRIE